MFKNLIRIGYDHKTGKKLVNLIAVLILGLKCATYY